MRLVDLFTGSMATPPPISWRSERFLIPSSIFLGTTSITPKYMLIDESCLTLLPKFYILLLPFHTTPSNALFYLMSHEDDTFNVRRQYPFQYKWNNTVCGVDISLNGCAVSIIIKLQ